MAWISLIPFAAGMILILLGLVNVICFNFNPEKFPRYNERAVDAAKWGMVLLLIALFIFGVSI